MNLMNDLPEEMDTWLESHLEVARGLTYERQPAVAEAARDRFIKEAEKARQVFYQDNNSVKNQKNPIAKWWSGLGVGLFPSFARAAFAFGIALVVIIGGTAGAVFASQSSLPGDFMYPVKLWGDELRIGLTSDPAEQLDLELEIAGERLQEMQQAQLLQQTRDQSQSPEEKTIPAAEQAYTGIYKHLDEALLLAQQLYPDDPEMLAQVTAQIEQQLMLLEDANPSVIIKELQELRKDLREQMKELEKAEPEPTAENTSAPPATAVPTAVESSEAEVTTEEDASAPENSDKEKETGQDKEKVTGQDKEKQNNSDNANSNSNNNSSNSSGNSSNNNKGGKKK
jgi:hypothetical protein